MSKNYCNFREEVCSYKVGNDEKGKKVKELEDKLIEAQEVLVKFPIETQTNTMTYYNYSDVNTWKKKMKKVLQEK
jgi:hypothetical protein